MMLLILTLLFICSSQPMVMVMSMILVTLFYSVMVYYVMGSFWYSYAFLLVMLTAVMVLFTYMASLCPNESFEYVGMALLSVVIYLYLYEGYWNQMEFVVVGDEMSLKLYKKVLYMLNLFMVSMLLAVMVMVVWVSGMLGVAVRGF